MYFIFSFRINFQFYVFGVSLCYLFNHVLSCFIFIIIVLTAHAYIGLWMCIHMIIDNHLPVIGQKYVWRYVCVFGFKYKCA